MHEQLSATQGRSGNTNREIDPQHSLGSVEQDQCARRYAAGRQSSDAIRRYT